jgi:Kdo2-lipid IVA lauroyltransferase/acyltransferase
MKNFKKKVRYALEGMLVKAIFFILNFLSIETSSAFGSWLFRKIGPKLRVSRVAADNILHSMPELTEAKRKKIIDDMWDNLGRTFCEFSHIPTLSTGEYYKRVKVSGEENLAHLKDGGLIFTGHMANWELIPKVLVDAGLGVSAVYRAANNKVVDQIITSCRKQNGMEMIPKGVNGLRKLIDALKQKHAIVMLIDQKMNSGIAVPFFGRKAMTAPAIANIALKYDCPIVPLQVVRSRGCNFEIKIHPPMDIKNLKNKNNSVAEIMLRINLQLEGWIRSNPGDWFWLHKRWP